MSVDFSVLNRKIKPAPQASDSTRFPITTVRAALRLIFQGHPNFRVADGAFDTRPYRDGDVRMSVRGSGSDSLTAIIYARILRDGNEVDQRLAGALMREVQAILTEAGWEITRGLSEMSMAIHPKGWEAERQRRNAEYAEKARVADERQDIFNRKTKALAARVQPIIGSEQQPHGEPTVKLTLADVEKLIEYGRQEGNNAERNRLLDPERIRREAIGAYVLEHSGVGDSAASVNRGADRYRQAALAAGESAVTGPVVHEAPDITGVLPCCGASLKDIPDGRISLVGPSAVTCPGRAVTGEAT